MITNNATMLNQDQVQQLQQIKKQAGIQEANYFELGKALIHASQTRAPELYTVLLSMNHYDIGSYASVGTKSTA